MQTLKRLVADEQAQSIAEYAIFAGLVSVVVVGAVTMVGGNAKTVFNNIATHLHR